MTARSLAEIKPVTAMAQGYSIIITISPSSVRKNIWINDGVIEKWI
jgi:hypothetical protein